jgi:predicted RNA binding protein YcfA (HicA-like mRNA interferase family)
MSDKLPVISGKKLISVLKGLGYEVSRQRGSHVRLEKITLAGRHKITVPNHDPIAKGTLSSIISKIALWNQMDKRSMINLFSRK